MRKFRFWLLPLALAVGIGFAKGNTAYATANNQASQTIKASSEIKSVTISGNKKTIDINMDNSSDTAGTDGSYYLFELKPYEGSIGARTDYLAKVSSGNVSHSVDLNLGTENDRLYSSFVVAAYDGSKYVEVSNPHYITNPEAVAKNTKPFQDPLTKKGLNIEIHMLPDAFELGVKHVGTNIAFHQILGEGIDFNYDGKTYHFNKGLIESYDKTISALSGKSMTVTAIVLNGFNPDRPELFHNGNQKNDKAYYYMFNAESKEGFETTKAIAAFLAQRYDGSNPDHGKISNWVIGNEINNQEWNYIGPRDLTSYIKSYEKAFRLFYTAIRSQSANDRVYYSIDFHWNNPKEKDGKLKYGGKEIVDSFNSEVMKKGNIDWGLAYHPYPYPMVEPEFWDDGNSGELTKDENSPIINFYNLSVLTDYFNNDARKTSSGHVRHIILTEQGFTAHSASRGEVDDIQAAAYAYSYYMVDSNPFIDAYILSRQIDAPSEVRQGIAFGLWKADMNQGDAITETSRRKIWQVFKNIDKKNSTLQNTEFAKQIIGIQKWSDVIPNFRWRSLEH